MDGFKIGNFQRNLVKITGTQGKPLSFKPGETVQAKVLSSSGSGVVTLKINDTLVAVKTEVPLPKDALVFFKVMGPDAGKADSELKLQFAGYAQRQPLPSSPKPSAQSGVNQLLLQASKLLANEQKWSNNFPRVIRQILKALPEDTSSLSRQTRVELLDVLKSSLKLTGQNIQENVNKLLQHLPEGTEPGSATGKLLRNLMVHIQKLSDVTLKDALENTGVALETRIKSLLMNRTGGQEPRTTSGSNTPARAPQLAGESGTEGRSAPTAQEIHSATLEAKIKAFLLNQPGGQKQETTADITVPAREPPVVVEPGIEGRPTARGIQGAILEAKLNALLMDRPSVLEPDGASDATVSARQPQATGESETKGESGSVAGRSTDFAAGTETKPAGAETGTPKYSAPDAEADPEPATAKDSTAKASVQDSSAKTASGRSYTLSESGLKPKTQMGMPVQMDTVDDEVETMPSSKPTLEGKGQQASVGVAGGEIEDSMPFQKDLKAVLSQLKALLDEENRDLLDKLADRNTSPSRGEAPEKLSSKELMKTIDGLLRDVETFQLLSKVTDSFYTFLPVVWDELRDGDIAFKKPRGGGNEDSYYCVINLNLERFGNLMIMVLMQQKEFFVSFKTGDTPLRSLLNSHAKELQGMFEESGIRLKGVNVLGNEDVSLVPFERLEAFDSVISIKV